MESQVHEQQQEQETKQLPEIPNDLLKIIVDYFISKHLTTRTDIIRFRAVCKSWRNLVKPPPTKKPKLPPFPIKLPHPITPNYLTTFNVPRRGYFNLSGNTLYFIFPECPPTVCENASKTFLARFESTESRKLRFLDPFSGLPPKNVPIKKLDSFSFGVIEVCKAYTVKYVNTSKTRFDTDRTLVVDKAVVIKNRVMVLYNQGDLGLLKYGSMRWKVTYDYRLDAHDDQTCYDDIMVFKDQFCVVNRTGRTLLISSNAKRTVEIAQPNCGLDGNRKNLVELYGELYMVDRDLDAYTTKLSKEGTSGRLVASELPTTMAVKFKIYKLDEEMHQWVQVNDLGDSILFVGYDCSFGCSARFLPGCKGNCLYFADDCYTYNSYFVDGEAVNVLRDLGCPEAGVFDLEDGTLKPLLTDPQHVALFWPPPAWLQSAGSSS